MNYILFDDQQRDQLLPFTHTRPVADIRCGIMTMRERWESLLGAPTSTLTTAQLQPVFPLQLQDSNIWINGAVAATTELATAVKNLAPGCALYANQLLLATHTVAATLPALREDWLQAAAKLPAVAYPDTITYLAHTWDIFSLNDQLLRDDFRLLTAGQQSRPIPEGVTAMGAADIFIAEGAVINPCIINATKGPVYVAAGAEIMEGCILRGPIAMGPGSVLKMGAKVYGATTIGEGCKVGGEVSNVVFFANSNKGHDGFLGNAVIGEWCNLGADTNCSNLKNNYDTVKIWSEAEHKLVSTGLQFCGLMMGDHSKCGINTMFNTGTVVGVSCNIYGSGFPEKFVPSFSWGGSEGISTYAFDKAMETARRMMVRRHKDLSPEAEQMYRHLFEQAQQQAS